jgi:hypothetical protein
MRWRLTFIPLGSYCRQQPTCLHDQVPIAKACRLLCTVRHHDDRDAVRKACAQHHFHKVGAFLVERASGFVEQQYGRGKRQRANQGHALSLAGGELHDRRIQQSGCEREPGRQVAGELQGCALEVVGDVLMPPAWFGGVVDDTPPPHGRRHGAAFGVIEEHIALTWIQVGDHPQEQTFAGARGASDSEAFPSLQAEVERPGECTAECGEAKADCAVA